MAKKPHPQQPQGAVDALLAIIAERGWRAASLAEVAQRAKVGLADLYEQYGDKGGILRAYADQLDEALLKSETPPLDESPRDRLFDVVMRRFDALQPHKEAIRALAREARTDPWLSLCGGRRALKAARVMLEVAGISTWGPAGRLKIYGLATVYVATMRTWLTDDTADMSKTMAALDRSLRRIEDIAVVLGRGRRSASRHDETLSAKA